AGEQTCTAGEQPRRLQAPVGRLALEWRIACPAEGPLSIRSDVLFDQRSGHVHFASLYRAGGSAERVLSSAERVWKLNGEGGAGGAAAASSSLGSYWLLGVEHIATGYDHLIFLLALLLMGGTFLSLAKVVSGFTVGHSLTLALASLGLVRPEIASIEALIGLSIVLVAAENVWLLGPRSYHFPLMLTALLGLLAVGAALGLGLVSSLSFLGLGLFLGCYYPLLRRNPNAESARWAVALLFGLIHGFGFASVLRAAELPAERLAGVLLSFNLGVEAGQLVLVAMAWPLLRFALARWGTLVVEVGSAVTLGFGIYWFVARTYS
ncbi:MAG TPA: HupE/UreJ family protein, partial [Thermoanaerobaculia bacterium]|nr:HupE/UreJ family protein [Thermoanaerobaculia bacterium]